MSIEMVSKGMDVADLRAGVVGSVIMPGDRGYDATRQGWNLAVEQSPRIIVDAECVADVQAAVRYARANGLPIAVMATGHGTPRSCDGLMIRMGRMVGVRVDAAARTARIEGGAKVKDVHAATAPYGLAMLGGSTTDVGVVGYTLGGGYGLMQRKHGLAVDWVREARIVTPDGEVVTASANENPDLFWAIRGGGGAFGVVVELTMELIPQATIYGGATIYPADDAGALVRAWTAWTKTLPEEVTTALLVMNLPPLPIVPEPLRGKAVVSINACVCGDLVNAEELVAPIRDLGSTPILDMWGAMPVAASDCIFNDPVDPMPATVRGALLHDLDEASADRMMAAIGPVAEMPQVAFQIRFVGGAMARVEGDATPMGAGRDARYLVYSVGVPNPFASMAALHDHAEGVFEALGEAILRRGPLNFIPEGDARSEHVRAAYDEASHKRLRTVKNQLDPTNAFRFASVGLD